jgi:hypothetical protein
MKKIELLQEFLQAIIELKEDHHYKLDGKA